ncbi:MAG: pheromone autoinducer 2 transporter [Rhodomicrobium sp.]|nr:MAG: pheromone autoinducer 2 transporter [Rhodomicrobium sp.]
MAANEIKNPYLGFICLVLGFVVIYLLKPVLLPVVLSLFLIAIAWPITVWLNSIFPKNISYVLSYVALIALFGFFAGLSYISIAQFISRMPEYESQFTTLLAEITAWLRSMGLPAPRDLNAEQLQAVITPFISTFYSTLGHLGLVVGLVILGLPELVYWEDKLDNCLGKSDGGRWRQAAAESAVSFQKYMTVMFYIGLLAGALTTGFCWAVGLDFALFWGLLAFIMNFLPIIGAALMMIPPTAMAAMQFNDPMMIWIVFGGMLGIQFFMGNIIDPKFQGKFLSMSPYIILVSIAFWTLIWGVPGAFLAVPLTHIFMIVFHQFPQTRKWACLLSEGKGSNQFN